MLLRRQGYGDVVHVEDGLRALRAAREAAAGPALRRPPLRRHDGAPAPPAPQPQRAPAFESLRKAKLRAASQPVMDGLESLRRLRAELPPGRLPYAVALSANVGSADRQQCAAAGYDAFLAKPVRGKDLAEALAAASAALRARPPPRAMARHSI
eukprot:tig00020616_g12260.t1